MPKGKLKVAERDELVDNLVTNCDCWSHKGSEKILNKMSDEQLIALNRAYLRRQQLEELEEVVANAGGLPESYERPAKGSIPDGGENDGRTSSGPDVASGQQDGSYDDDSPEDDDDRDESEMDTDRQTPGKRAVGDGGSVTNRNRKSRRPMSAVQWLDAAQAPQAIRDIVMNSIQQDADLKDQLIEVITANKSNPYSDEDLASMTTNQLRPLAKLASAGRTNGHSRLPPNYLGSQGAQVQNRRRAEDGVATKEEDMLTPVTINFDKDAKPEQFIRRA